MKLTKIELNNFLSYKHEVIDLTNLTGLVLIRGENRDHAYSYDSNGCGKTSILDSICWGLYGQTSRGAKGDALINRDAKKNCSVTLHLEHDGTCYTITRYRKHSEHQNAIMITVDSNNITGIEQQTWIDALIGCDINTFTNIFFFYQTAVKFFAELSDAHQKEILSSLLNLSILDTLNYHSKELVEECTKLQSELSQKVMGCTTRNKIREADVQDLKTKRDSFKAEKDEELTALEDKQRTAQEALDIYDDVIAKELDSLTSLHKTETEIKDVHATKLAGLTVDIRLLQDKAEKLVEPLKAAELSKSTKESDLKSLTTQKEQVDALGPVCRECYQKIDDKHKAKMLKDLDTEITEYTELVARFTREVTKLKDEHSDLRNKITTSKTAQIAEKTLLDNKQADINKLDAKIAVFEERAKEKKQVMVDALVSITNHIQEVSATKNPYADQIKTKTDEIAIDTAKKDELLVEQEYVTLLKSHREYLQTLTSNSGAKSHILTSIVPFLNAKAAHYSEKFTDGSITIEFNTITQLKSGEYRDKFTVDLLDKGKATNYTNFSGGERRRINICILLALRQLALLSIPANKRLKLAIYDETFDHLDDVGYMRALELLQEEYDTSDDLCLLVSHNPHMERNVKHQVVAIKENGESKAEVI